ncbi:ImmA/IrrE family metallo-endopeptidase [Rhodococcus hoagii]|nr:ImmA/IrrE family metallo-endopeptidase [Prescottella equi]NKS74709.1 ImmA/IrrE family metallo-endopeptidase [Prescottella equi]NKZ88794.1 ImmA/IrrE family metallo-endopeptidase [Prescottella equi]
MDNPIEVQGGGDQMTSTPTTASGLAYSAVREYAERIGRAHDIYSTNGHADIDALLERIGGRVVNANSSESLRVYGEGDFEISVPTHTSKRRDRFTVAHELGHYFLHYRYPNLDGEMSYNRGGQSRAETEANVFAASLLMPEEQFCKAFSDCNGDHWLLSEIFDVSPAAAEVRSRTLNLV